ncbi:MAG: hypothetical protein N4A43_00735 [Alphaproteobacteria bacterium]|jgi:nitrogen fixation-related uncharacterized protein|nr:hypothetical protein [Alphaproteobacteria bacterium]
MIRTIQYIFIIIGFVGTILFFINWAVSEALFDDNYSCIDRNGIWHEEKQICEI